MLRGLNPLLGPDLLKVLRSMGHGDEIAIVDGNYPADTDAKLLVRMDGHSATDILGAVLSVMPLDTMAPDCAFRPLPLPPANDTQPIFAEFAAIINKWEPAIHISILASPDFYARVKACYAVIASSESRLYGNIVLKKGVIDPK